MTALIKLVKRCSDRYLGDTVSLDLNPLNSAAKARPQPALPAAVQVCGICEQPCSSWCVSHAG